MNNAVMLIDISRKIANGVAVYEGDEPLAHSPLCEIGTEAPCQITELGGWTTHFLTHVDAPCHFIKGGKTLNDIELSRFFLPAVVVSVDDYAAIEARHVPQDVQGRAVLFKTRNSQLEKSAFHEDHVYISLEAAESLIAGGAAMVGIDYLSVDRYGDEEYPAHRALLAAEVLVLEGTDMTSAPEGVYRLACFPLSIDRGDGSPVRAVLLDPEN